MTEDDIRNGMLQRLTERGWIASSWVKEVPPNGIQMIVNWTPLGIDRMRRLHSRLTELGLESGYIVGQFGCLHDLAGTCVRQHGRQETGDLSGPHKR